MAFAPAVAKALDAALAETEKHATTALRNDAAQSSWPADAVKSLAATVDDSGAVSASVADQYFDYEYGDEERPPSGVIRSFDNRVETDVDQVFLGYLEQNLQGII